MKEMGVNAIRTSHNPPAPELLELCDRMGLRGDGRSVRRLAAQQEEERLPPAVRRLAREGLRALVRRDRNHPSVILWSTGNEIGEQGNPEGHKLAAAIDDRSCTKKTRRAR